MSAPLRAYVELRGHGARGPRYQVRMNQPNGMVIIDATTEPLFAAARLLLAKGIAGRLQIWDNTRPYCRLQGDIERLAGLTVAEDQKGISLRKYVDRTTDGELEDEALESPETQVDRPECAPQPSGIIKEAA